MSATNGNELRRRILDHARHMLVEEGYQQLSMRKIAQAVGCSATSIYLYFESKDVLLHTLIEEGFDKLNSRIDGAIAGVESAPQSLCVLISVAFEFALTHGEYYELMFLVRPAQMGRYPAEKFRKARSGIVATAKLIRQLDHIESDDRAYRLAWYVWSSLHGAISIIRSRRLDVRVGLGAFVATVFEQLMQTLGLADDVADLTAQSLAAIEPMLQIPDLV